MRGRKRLKRAIRKRASFGYFLRWWWSGGWEQRFFRKTSASCMYAWTKLNLSFLVIIGSTAKDPEPVERQGIKKKVLNGGCMLMTHIFFILPPFCLALMAEWGYLKRCFVRESHGCEDMRKPLICKFLTSKKGLLGRSEDPLSKTRPSFIAYTKLSFRNFRFKEFLWSFPSPASIYDRRINV